MGMDPVSLAAEAAPLAGYRFTISCPQCGGEVEEINRVRQTTVAEIVVVACTGSKCGRQYDLALRLTPIRKEGQNR